MAKFDFSNPFFTEIYKYMDRDFDQLVKCGIILESRRARNPFANATSINPNMKSADMDAQFAKMPNITRASFVAKYAFALCVEIIMKTDASLSDAVDMTITILRHKLWMAGYSNNDITRAVRCEIASVPDTLRRQYDHIAQMAAKLEKQSAR